MSTGGTVDSSGDVAHELGTHWDTRIFCSFVLNVTIQSKNDAKNRECRHYLSR